MFCQQQMAGSFRQEFEGIQDRLEESIDVDYGLLSMLQARKVITARHRTAIEALPDRYRRASNLLEILTRRDDQHLQIFCQSLVDIGQRDIAVDLLGYKPEAKKSKEQTATTSKRAMAKKSHEQTASMTTTSQRGRRKARLSIGARSTPQAKRSQKLPLPSRPGLVRIKRAGPDTVYGRLAEERLLGLLNEVAEAVNKHCSSPLEEWIICYKEASDSDEREYWRDCLHTELKKIAEEPPKEVAPLIAELLLKVFLTNSRIERAEPGDSIYVYCSCKTVEALYALKDLINLDELFSKILSYFATCGVRAIVSMSNEDFDRCYAYLTTAAEEVHSSETSKLPVDESKVTAEMSVGYMDLNYLPVELLEMMMMRAFLLLYGMDFTFDDDDVASARSLTSERDAFSTLASVCSDWWLTLTGWPQSSTGHWLKHTLKKRIERSCRPFTRLPRLNHIYGIGTGHVVGVTQLNDVVYIVCRGSSTILRFNATTHEQLTDIDVKDLSTPWDIAACEQTSQLYVSCDRNQCVWRVSADGADIKHWLPRTQPGTLRPWTLSVTSTRLLVTSCDKQLWQFDAGGVELRRVELPRNMDPLHHAVESAAGTFIVSHLNTKLHQGHVSEVDTAGQVLRQFTGSHLLPVGYTPHLAVDSQDNVLVADCDNRRILLLDSHLSLRRVIIDQHQLDDKRPYRLCYREQTGQLLIGLTDGSVAVFDVHST